MSREPDRQGTESMRWDRLILVLWMVAALWYRAHTFGPDIREATGLSLWPVVGRASEPLDCDEAAYAYMGHRVLLGDALYRDLTEYKPPLGYWIYSAAVALGGYRELAIRVLAIPFVLAAMAAAWWVALRLSGRIAAAVSPGLFLLVSTDPYLFGNGSNMEHFMNLFSILGLAATVGAWTRADRRWLVAAGVAIGAAAMVKQVAVVPAPVVLGALLIRGGRSRRGLIDAIAFGAGILAVVVVAGSIVMARGAGRSAYEDIVLQARALATDTLPEPNAPSGAVRWLTGNADPRGELPWPFGSTDYLVWWAGGSWPFWLASVGSVVYLAAGEARRRMVAGWVLASWLQVVLPGLYWPHYYLLPVPASTIAVAIALGDAIGAVADPSRDGRRGLIGLSTAALVVAIAGTLVLQARCYLGVEPEELTIRYKGGRQWVVLREMGREIGRRVAGWDSPKLYVWGWQSPLNFYSRLDSPTRHFFVDNLLRDQAGRDHPLIGPRVEEILSTLKDRPPELIFTGYPPFPKLRAFLDANYLPSTMARGLYLRRGVYGRFETAGSGATHRESTIVR